MQTTHHDPATENHLGSVPQQVATAGQLQMPQLSIYTDFRSYLKDVYDFKIKTLSTPMRAYNYAAFSASADIKSPNYLKLIIEGQRNLSPEMAKKFSKALGHNRDEAMEFQVLVKYGQAKEPLERNRYLKELADIRVQRQLDCGDIKKEAFHKVPNWVTWVLHAMADQKNVDFDLNSLRDIMRGRASLDEIKKAMLNLFEAEELVKDGQTGEVKKGRLLMQGSEDIPPELVRKLQAELIYLGLESLFQDGPTEREFGAFTIALTDKEFEQMKFELRQMRKRLFKDFSMQREQSKGDRVYQLNIQLFPVTNYIDPK